MGRIAMPWYAAVRHACGAQPPGTRSTESDLREAVIKLAESSKGTIGAQS